MDDIVQHRKRSCISRLNRVSRGGLRKSEQEGFVWTLPIKIKLGATMNL